MGEFNRNRLLSSQGILLTRPVSPLKNGHVQANVFWITHLLGSQTPDQILGPYKLKVLPVYPSVYSGYFASTTFFHVFPCAILTWHVQSSFIVREVHVSERKFEAFVGFSNMIHMPDMSELPGFEETNCIVNWGWGKCKHSSYLIR